MIKAIVFDIGGVLAYDVWEHLLLDENVGVASQLELDPQVVESVAVELWEMFAYHDETLRMNWQAIEESYWAHFIERFNLTLSVDFFIQLTDQFILPIPGMSELINEVRKKGLDLAICSNNNAFWSRRQLAKLDFAQNFEPQKIILSNQIGHAKASPGFEMFQAVVDALEVDRTSCLFIDDRPSSIEWAGKFGMPGILFPSHSKYGADYLRSLFQLLNII